jgi:hypothetical protein
MAENRDWFPENREEQLEDKMRDIKKHSFFVPPMTEADMAGPGLSPAPHPHRGSRR